MKRFSILFLAAAVVLGCSSMESLFETDNQDVMKPVELDFTAEVELMNGTLPLVSRILENNKVLDNNSKVVAFVVNNKSILEETLQGIRKELPADSSFMQNGIPEIDFDRYSLVIGVYAEPGQPVKFASRVKRTVAGYKMFVRLSSFDTPLNGGAAQKPFSVLYEKLPDGPLKVSYEYVR